MDPKMAGALCYVPFVGWIVAIVMLLTTKNQGVKWNAVQALLFSIAIWVVTAILGWTRIFSVLSPLVWIGGMIVQLVAAVKVYQGDSFRLPMVAEWTDKTLKKV